MIIGPRRERTWWSTPVWACFSQSYTKYFWAQFFHLSDEIVGLLEAFKLFLGPQKLPIGSLVGTGEVNRKDSWRTVDICFKCWNFRGNWWRWGIVSGEKSLRSTNLSIIDGLCHPLKLCIPVFKIFWKQDLRIGVLGLVCAYGHVCVAVCWLYPPWPAFSK